ncbi:22639_t:CDS:1, partial [Gigaspora rosea]
TKERKKKGRWKYKYEQMSEEDWKEFAKQLDNKVEKGNYQPILTSADLNKAWNKLVDDISCTSKQLIPRAKIIPKTSYEFTTLATKLHSALNKINKLIRALKSKSAKSREEINMEITKINKLSGLNIPSYVYEKPSSKDIEEWIYRLKEYQKGIRKARSLENKIQHRDQINYYVDKRYGDFTT